MKRNIVFPLNPIQKRANSKIVDMNGRYFLIGKYLSNQGGMTISKNTRDIFQFRVTNPQEQKYQVQWRPLKFQNHIFTPRNSFSACSSQTKLYIWGGLQSNQKQMKQKCLSDLIQVDIQKGKMRLLQLNQNIPIHSASLFYDKDSNSLIGFGGTNENSSMQAYLYELNLSISQNQQKYQWKKSLVKNSTAQGVLWQHSGAVYKRSLFIDEKNKNQGRFLLLVGGCRYPWSPYKSIIQIDLNTNQVTHSSQLQQALVAHEIIYDHVNNCVYIIGGANGGGLNRLIYKISSNGYNQKQSKIDQKLKIDKFQGHNAVGCACVLTKQNWLIVYGGVCGPQMLNDMIIYHQ